MASKRDDRNKELYAIVDGAIVPRSQASIPLWDAGFLHGKQIWSSPRLVNGKIFRLQDHLDKIRHGIEAIHCPIVPEDYVFIDAVRRVLLANKMEKASGVHIRIIFTPGTQFTASMNTKAIRNWDGTPASPRIIVMPEWRETRSVYDASRGEQAILSQYRRPGPSFADQRIHSNNQIHSSLACDEANAAGVAAALMLNGEGFLAEAHASHAAIVKEGVVYTPHVKCCPPGVTRKVILEICETNGIDAREDDIGFDRVVEADEVFIMGTMSGPVGITHVDGKAIGSGEVGRVTMKLQKLYENAMVDEKNLFDIFAHGPSLKSG